jgi:hypothetical protein
MCTTRRIVIWPDDSRNTSRIFAVKSGVTAPGFDADGANSLKTQLLVFGVVLRWCSPVSAEAESIAALSV